MGPKKIPEPGNSDSGIPYFILGWCSLGSGPREEIATLPWAGLLTLGSFYSPHLPVLSNSGILTAFVPDHSGGSVTVSHRFPLMSSTDNPSGKFEPYYHLLQPWKSRKI